MMRGISKYADTYGPWAFDFCSPLWLIKDYRNRWVNYIRKWNPDGIIMRELEDMDEINRLNVPTIVSSQKSESYEGFANFVGQQEKIGRLAAEHLLDECYRNFGFYGFDGFYFSDQRRKFFTERISNNGYDVSVFEDKSYKKTYSWGLWLNQKPALCDWLASLEKPVGIMAANDERGRQVLEACKIVGLNVPNEVGVLGCGNDKYFCSLSPALSSITLGSFMAGYKAAALLDKLIQGQSMRDQTITFQAGHVVARNSTDLKIVKDEIINKALTFIRNNRRRLIQVDDVAEHIQIPRRSLQRRFSQVMKRHVHQEIVKNRIAYITELLRDTEIPICEIALYYGYHDNKNFSRFFKKEMNLTPSEYREVYGR
jgi:LacI family transcriptional regulator